MWRRIQLPLSRRRLLGGTLVATAIAVGADALAVLPAHAVAKTSQADAGYQASPKGNDHCEVCGQFEAPSTCKIVDGSVSPHGWCKLFAHK